uniref:Ankyrin repeat protein n=1 Tax=Panagrolaimus sp. PS1159 TaxID=55785 RepID=A0AC35G7F7_9BILA
MSEKTMNLQDNDGNSILHLAAQHGYEDIVTNIIVSGAYFNLQNNKSQTPEMLAKNQEHQEIENFLRCVHELFENLDRINEEKYNCISMSPFVVPVFKSNLIQACDSNGKNLLHHAVENQKIEVAKTLLKVNRQLANKKDKIGKTPLFYAIKNDDLEMMDLLLKKGAKVELWKYANNCTNGCSKFINKVNKLFNMAKEGDVISLEYELQKEKFELDLSTVINMRNHENLSLIKIAEDTVNFELVKLLLTKGGMILSFVKNKAIYNKELKKLYSFIIKIFECVESKKYAPSSIIYQIKKHSYTDMMMKVRYDDLEGDTLLHIAAKADDAEIFEWLLENRANIDLKNFDGQKACDLAGKDSKVLAIVQKRSSVID